MLNQLHDEIDRAEENRDKAKAIVEEIVRKALRQAIEEGMSPASALDLAASEVEDALTDLTTTAFNDGVANSRARSG